MTNKQKKKMIRVAENLDFIYIIIPFDKFLLFSYKFPRCDFFELDWEIFKKKW